MFCKSSKKLFNYQEHLRNLGNSGVIAENAPNRLRNQFRFRKGFLISPYTGANNQSDEIGGKKASVQYFLQSSTKPVSKTVCEKKRLQVCAEEKRKIGKKRESVWDRKRTGKWQLNENFFFAGKSFHSVWDKNRKGLSLFFELGN